MAIKSPLRYPGGKSRAVNIIAKYIPKGTKKLCSPFFGGGSFEIACAQTGTRVYGYDSFQP
ncbi:MAG: DNA adenine methylase, partial [Candidatus Nitrosotenuis sp.]